MWYIFSVERHQAEESALMLSRGWSWKIDHASGSVIATSMAKISTCPESSMPMYDFVSTRSWSSNLSTYPELALFSLAFGCVPILPSVTLDIRCQGKQWNEWHKQKEKWIRLVGSTQRSLMQSSTKRWCNTPSRRSSNNLPRITQIVSMPFPSSQSRCKEIICIGWKTRSPI